LICLKELNKNKGKILYTFEDIEIHENDEFEVVMKSEKGDAILSGEVLNDGKIRLNETLTGHDMVKLKKALATELVPKPTDKNTTESKPAKTLWKSEFLKRNSTIPGDIKGKLTAYPNKVGTNRKTGEELIDIAPELDIKLLKVLKLFFPKISGDKSLESIESRLGKDNLAEFIDIYAELTAYGMRDDLLGSRNDPKDWGETIDALIEMQIGIDYWEKLNLVKISESQSKEVRKVLTAKRTAEKQAEVYEATLEKILNSEEFVQNMVNSVTKEINESMGFK
jgi:hypothetical protein